MLTGKEYSSKDEEKKKRFREFMARVENAREALRWLLELRKHKVKVDNNYLLQTTIRQVANSYKSPLRRLSNLIKYKASKLGMQVIETPEHYTSKSSSQAQIE